MKNKYDLFLWVAFLYFLGTSASYAQSSHKGNYWLGVGLGKSQYPSGMMALGYEFANKPTQLIARYVANWDIFSDHQPGTSVNELGFLYGLRVSKFRFSAGLSGVWGTNRGKFLFADPDPLIYGSYVYEGIPYKTIGLPAEIRFITSTKDIGIGVTGFGNLNGKRSFIGLNLSLYVGKMK